MIDEQVRQQAMNDDETDDAPSAGIVLTEDQLQQLLRRAAQEARSGSLPPTAFYGEDGQVFRKVPHPTGRIQRGKLVYQWRIRPVVVAADNTPDGQRKAQITARMQGYDYYKPGIGWLRDGWCREKDAPENLGIGNERFEEFEVELPVSDADEGSTSVTVPGRPMEASDEQPEPAGDVRRPRGRPRKSEES